MPVTIRDSLSVKLFTGETRAKIVKMVRLSVSPTMAARACGVPYNVFKGWLNRARKYAKDTEEYAAFVDFYLFAEELASAEAEGFVQMHVGLRTGRTTTKTKDGEEKSMQVASSLAENWKWLLKNRAPREYNGSVERFEVSGPDGKAIAHTVTSNVFLFVPPEDDAGDPKGE